MSETEPIAAGWVTCDEAARVTGYSIQYVRRLIRQKRVPAHRVKHDWLVHLESLLAYRARMDALGMQKHNPWRGDLAAQGRGRKRDE